MRCRTVQRAENGAFGGSNRRFWAQNKLFPPRSVGTRSAEAAHTATHTRAYLRGGEGEG